MTFVTFSLGIHTEFEAGINYFSSKLIQSTASAGSCFINSQSTQPLTTDSLQTLKRLGGDWGRYESVNIRHSQRDVGACLLKFGVVQFSLG